MEGGDAVSSGGGGDGGRKPGRYAIMPLPAIAVGMAVGAIGNLTMEYVLSGGKASRQDYQHAAIVGALPVGLGLGGGIRLGRKVAHTGVAIRSIGRHPIDKTPARVYLPRIARAYLPDAQRVGIGFAASAAVRKGMEFKSQIGGHTQPTQQTRRGLSGTPSLRTASSEARSSILGRGRCKAKYRGRRCILPAGHKGRHRYETK